VPDRRPRDDDDRRQSDLTGVRLAA
jgi:hypothetical protein